MSYDEVRDIMGEPDGINECSFSVGSGSHWQCYTFPTPPKMEELLLILFIEGESYMKAKIILAFVTCNVLISSKNIACHFFIKGEFQ